MDFQEEQPMILRVPFPVAQRIREMMAQNSFEDVEISFQDERRGKFRIGGSRYDAKLMDLPCIIESLKTFDKNTYYKTGDISQMLVVSNETSAATPAAGGSSPPTGAPPTDEPINEEDYKLDSGLTPPTRLVRKYWKSKSHSVDIEKIRSMEKLFAESAVEEEQNVKFEFVDYDEYQRLRAGGPMALAASTPSQLGASTTTPAGAPSSVTTPMVGGTPMMTPSSQMLAQPSPAGSAFSADYSAVNTPSGFDNSGSRMDEDTSQQGDVPMDPRTAELRLAKESHTANLRRLEAMAAKQQREIDSQPNEFFKQQLQSKLNSTLQQIASLKQRIAHIDAQINFNG